mmetsp:Transcript_11854/g.39002  ORF Transcript_11854/g.39002 Transcript_11854/m.39002 type:complete len:787 (+) Transcript_11854:618-2978(+)
MVCEECSASGPHACLERLREALDGICESLLSVEHGLHLRKDAELGVHLDDPPLEDGARHHHCRHLCGDVHLVSPHELHHFVEALRRLHDVAAPLLEEMRALLHKLVGSHARLVRRKFERLLGDPRSVLGADGAKKLDEVVPVAFREPRDHAAVEEHDGGAPLGFGAPEGPPVAAKLLEADHDVPGVEVGVHKVVLDHHFQQGAAANRSNLFAVLLVDNANAAAAAGAPLSSSSSATTRVAVTAIRRRRLEEALDAPALLERLDEHRRAHEREDGLWELHFRHRPKVVVELFEVRRLEREVDLLKERRLELAHALVEPQPRERRNGGGDGGERLEDGKVARDGCLHRGMPHLDGELLQPVRPLLAAADTTRALRYANPLLDVRMQYRTVHLRYGTGRDRLTLKLEEERLERLPESLLHHRARVRKAVRRGVSLQLRQLPAHVLRKEVGARRGPLAPFDEGWAGEGERAAQGAEPRGAADVERERGVRCERERQKEPQEAAGALHERAHLEHGPRERHRAGRGRALREVRESLGRREEDGGRPRARREAVRGALARHPEPGELVHPEQRRERRRAPSRGRGCPKRRRRCRCRVGPLFRRLRHGHLLRAAVRHAARRGHARVRAARGHPRDARVGAVASLPALGPRRSSAGSATATLAIRNETRVRTAVARGGGWLAPGTAAAHSARRVTRALPARIRRAACVARALHRTARPRSVRARHLRCRRSAPTASSHRSVAAVGEPATVHRGRPVRQRSAVPCCRYRSSTTRWPHRRHRIAPSDCRRFAWQRR